MVASLGTDRKGMRRKEIREEGLPRWRRSVKEKVGGLCHLAWLVLCGTPCTECRPGQPEQKGCCSEAGSKPLRGWLGLGLPVFSCHLPIRPWKLMISFCLNINQWSIQDELMFCHDWLPSDPPAHPAGHSANHLIGALAWGVCFQEQGLMSDPF